MTMRTCAQCGIVIDADNYTGGTVDDEGNWFCTAECCETYQHEHHETLYCEVCGETYPESEVIDGCCKKCLAEM